MAEPDRERDLPAGVIGGAEAPDRHDSHVRAKAPERSAEREAHAEEKVRAMLLVDALVEASRHEMPPIVRQLLPLGSHALEELSNRFPGEMWAVTSTTETQFPEPEDLSAVCAALATFDSEAVPYLVRLLQNPSPKTRFCAVVVSAYLRHPRLVGSLVRATTDEDRACRRVAVHALIGFRETASYQEALGMLRRIAANAADSSGRRRHAVSALTQLRDTDSVRLLVDLLENEDLGLATAGRVGLRVLTGHDFGFSRAPWLRWLAERGSLHRIEWLIRALGDSRANIRELAAQELWRETRLVRPLGPDATREAYALARRQYREWWGRQLLTGIRD